VEERTHSPNIRSKVDRSALALFRREKERGGGQTKRKRPAVFGIEDEDVDRLTGDTRPEGPNAMGAQIPMDDTVRVGVRQFVANIEGEVHGICDAERSVVPNHRGQ
jgi:hypothetical protein